MRRFRTMTACFLLTGCLGPAGKGAKNAPSAETHQAPVELNLPFGLSYELRTKDQHTAHILSIDPRYYRLEIVKAHHQVFGRETVPAIAKRKGAIAATNAGFFEIGQNEDGRPSGTLLINGRIFGLAKGVRSLLALSDQKAHIGQATTTVQLKIDDKLFTPDYVNRFVRRTDETVLYNDAWGMNSLTPYDRNEVLIDQHSKIIDVVNHGDNPIPRGGWILSLPKKSPIQLTRGMRAAAHILIKDKISDNEDDWRDAKDVIMGIPLLVRDGAVVSGLEKTGSASFAAHPQARTAIGVRADGSIVLVVVEHAYVQPLRQVTLAQIADILRKEGYSQLRLAIMTVPQIRSIVEKHLTAKSTSVGMTLAELASLMVDLKCDQAINLDGGGSSTLFLNDRVLNTVIGDQDEAMGQEVLRPVSDAIVVTKRL